MSDDPEETGAEEVVNEEENTGENPEGEQEEAVPPPPPKDPYAFDEKQMEIWTKWTEGKAEEDADLGALKQSLAEEFTLSLNQIEKIVQCGLYAGDRDAEHRRHGFGKAILANGDRYEGHYEAGLRHGSGKYTFAAGGLYEGEYARGKRHGKGTIVYKDGSRYDGAWENDVYHGEGSITYPNHDIYSGTFRNGVRHGHGVYTVAATGEKYEGDWVDGQRHGHGTWHLTKDAQFVGVFDADKPLGQGTFVFQSGAKEAGDYAVRKVEKPAASTFKIVKADEEPAEEEEGAKKKPAKPKKAITRGTEDALQFRGSNWNGVHVYM